MTGRFLFALAAIGLASAASVASAQCSAQPTCDIESGFDYVGQNIKSVSGAAVETCCDRCRVTPGCLAWSWNAYNGGTCWLKSSVTSIVVNAGVKSGRMTTASNGCALYKDVDFKGNDIGSKTAGKPQDCCDICKSTPNCRAYSWNNYQGGTCWLKSKRGEAVFAQDTVSADAFSNGWPFYQPVMVYKTQEGVKIQGTEINSFEITNKDCLTACKEYDGACVGVTSTRMHHTTCTLFSSINGTTSESFSTSYTLITAQSA